MSEKEYALETIKYWEARVDKLKLQMRKYTDEIVRLTNIVKMEEQREKQQAKANTQSADTTTKKKTSKGTDQGTGIDPVGGQPIAGGLVNSQE